MEYTFQWGVALQNLPGLFEGAKLTFIIGILVFWGAALIGLATAAVKTYGPRWAAALAQAYVVFFTNTPALVQIWFLYFGLPDVGIVWDKYTCLVIGLTLNSGAYMTEIIRAGFISVRRTEIEAAETLGFSRLQQIWHVIVPHIAKTIYPALANFFIVILVMGTSIGSVVGVGELTSQAKDLSTEDYRYIETFTIAAAIYVVLTFVASLTLALAGRWAFRVKAKVF
jgi:polar amino acid transport system permease protein